MRPRKWSRPPVGLGGAGALIDQAVEASPGEWEGVEDVMFERLARVINRVPWVVVGVAIAFAAIAGVLGGPVAKSLQVGGFQDLSTQSSLAIDRLQSASGLRA